MTVELVEAIGKFIVMPICVIAYVYLAWRNL